MRPRPGRMGGNPRRRAPARIATALATCACLVGVAACGEEEEPPGSTPGSIEPIGELAGPSVPLDDKGGFENILALTVESAGETRTLIAGQVVIGRAAGSSPADAEVRIAVDGKEERDAEARTVTSQGGETVVIACACELEPGEHEIELQGRANQGSTPVSARSLVALDGVDYASEPSSGGGPLPPAVNGAALETDSLLVTGAPTSLAQARLAPGSSDSGPLLIVGQVGSTRSSVDASGVSLQAGAGDTEGELLVSLPSASTRIDVFALDGAGPGESVELLGNFIGGGNAELDLRSMITCPCTLETAPES